jgi:hypothetical protein
LAAGLPGRGDAITINLLRRRSATREQPLAPDKDRPVAATAHHGANARTHRSKTMTGAYRIHATGGPEVLRWESVDLPQVTGDLVRIRHTAIGLN